MTPLPPPIPSASADSGDCLPGSGHLVIEQSTPRGLHDRVHFPNWGQGQKMSASEREAVRGTSNGREALSLNLEMLNNREWGQPARPLNLISTPCWARASHALIYIRTPRPIHSAWLLPTWARVVWLPFAAPGDKDAACNVPLAEASVCKL